LDSSTILRCPFHQNTLKTKTKQNVVVGTLEAKELTARVLTATKM